MYEVIAVTVLATISVLLGLSFILPDTPSSTPKKETTQTVSTPETKSTSTPPSPDQTNPDTADVFPPSCYDAITVREKGRVYIFQSKKPLQENVNPVIFPDLPSYRVWAERSLGDGLKCPVLYYDPDAEPFIHTEEQYAGSSDKRMIRSSKRTQQDDPSLTDTWKVYDDSTLAGTRDKKSSYIRSSVMEPARYVAADGVVDDVSAPIPPYAEASGRVRHEMHDNLITRSQREAVGRGADQPAPIPSRNPLRDVSRREIAQLTAEMEEKDPSMRGAVLKRTGYSQYEVDEVIPEREGEGEDIVDDGVRNTFGMGRSGGLDIDLLAYGGTVVPVKNVNRLFG